MPIWRALTDGLRRLFRTRAVERELDDEVRHYLEMATRDHQRAGLSPEDAAKAARVELGSTESVKEHVRSSGWEAVVGASWRDVLYALRMLRRTPAFTSLAVLVLAIGIGVNTGIFSIVNAVLFQPPPGIDAPEELAYVYRIWPPLPYRAGEWVGYPTYQLLRQKDEVFSDVLAWSLDEAKLRAGGEVERTRGEKVTANYFALLRAKASIGRTVVPGEDEQAATPVVVISDSMWKRRFGSDPGVVGKTIGLDVSRYFGAYGVPKPYTIIGVMPPDFRGMSSPWEPTQYWVLLSQRVPDYPARGNGPERLQPAALANAFVHPVARLKRGVSLDQARAAIAPLAAGPGRQPDEPAWSLGIRDGNAITLPFNYLLVPGRLAAALLALSSLILLIAAANLAGMLTARGVTRRAEIAVRLSLGAGRWRLVRQLLTENLVLSIAGGACGVVLSRLFVNTFLAKMPASPYPSLGAGDAALAVPLDGRVWLFAALTSLVTAVLVGLLPAIQMSKTDLVGALSGGSAVAAPRLVRSRLRHWIVIPQVCLALVLLLVAGAVVQTLLKSEAIDAGYDPDHVVLVGFELPATSPDSAAERAQWIARQTQLYARLLESVRALPGVSAASLTMVANSGVGLPAMTTSVIARDTFAAGDHHWTYQADVSWDYFRAMGIPLLRGRDFTLHDNLDAPLVTIVSESLARTLWPGKDPTGSSLAIHTPDSAYAPIWLEVIGVVKDAKLPLSEGGPHPAMYRPLHQGHTGVETIVARGPGAPAQLIKDIREAVHKADATAFTSGSATMAAAVEQLRSPRRMAASLLSLSGLIGLGLASIGLYGVVSFSVAQRSRELGIRAALGADRTNIMALVIKEGARVAAVGLLLGGVLAFAAIRITSSSVVAIPKMDPATIVIVPMLLLIVILVACYVPARRAARTDPMVVLRGL